ncbi:hypothetical protein DY000_02019120 [Brassica cretica]|uniref:DUF4005 domain-containing protein n=1 Tax=Brassica cretica TaxID=69181 RepID=A0ABQ7CNN8_BRACR|nr:hypothetical protein DY000_02019120 [Brassica cretica]
MAGHATTEPRISSEKVVNPTHVAKNFLDRPPGFPPMFSELSPSDHQQALMYISHPDERERLARIKRVQLSITEKQEGRDKLKSISLGGTPRRASAPLEVPETSDQSFSSALIATSTTGFSVGTSSRNFTAGALSSQKKPRNRPTSWKRKLRSSLKPLSTPGASPNNEGETDNSSKRKAESTGYDSTKRSSLNQDITVASSLKPMPPQ